MPMFSDTDRLVEQAEVLVHHRDPHLGCLAPADGQVELLPVHRDRAPESGAW